MYALLAVEKTMIRLLFELIRLRDNYLVFSGAFKLNHSDFSHSLFMCHLFRYLINQSINLLLCGSSKVGLQSDK